MIAKLELSTGTFQNTIFTRKEEMNRQFCFKLMAPSYNSIHIRA